jgi:hypothetical protein
MSSLIYSIISTDRGTRMDVLLPEGAHSSRGTNVLKAMDNLIYIL